MPVPSHSCLSLIVSYYYYYYAGNIFNGKSNPNQSPVVNNTKGGLDPKGAKINKRFHGLVPSEGGHDRTESVDTCSVNPSLMMPSSSSSVVMHNKRDRNKLCGSLPNYLDDAGDDDYKVDHLQLADMAGGRGGGGDGKFADCVDHRIGTAAMETLICTDSTTFLFVQSTTTSDALPGGSNNEGLAKVEYVTVETSRPPSHADFAGPSGVRPPSSPFNTSSSGKGSIASSSNLGSSSTFKSIINGGE